MKKVSDLSQASTSSSLSNRKSSGSGSIVNELVESSKSPVSLAMVRKEIKRSNMTKSFEQTSSGGKFLINKFFLNK